MTSLPAERHVRKGLGAFYSPRSLVEPTVAWAVRAPTESVLDPSCGDGVFVEAAARKLKELGASVDAIAAQVRAIDLNPQAVRMTSEVLRHAVGPREVKVSARSFFSLEPPDDLFADGEAVDCVVGNPPYIRYQEFAGASRRHALTRAANAGVELTRLASSWAHFVAHAIAFLKRKGRLALILPAELIHASYAAPLRRHLRESFREVFVVSFKSAVFPGAQEEVVLLLADGRGEPHRQLGLVEVDSGLDLGDLDELVKRAQTYEKGVEPAKWVPGYTGNGMSRALERLTQLGLLVPLGQIGKAGIGFVSGANEYFVLTPEEAAHWKLPESSLQPALVRARQVPDLVVTKKDVEELKARNERCLLWLPGAELTKSEKVYVAHGEGLGIHERYKCRVRTPWYVVPGVVVPEAYLTYMSDTVPRLCLNQARVTSTNTLLAVRLQKVPAKLRKAFVVAFYNSATLLSCERTGRSYGGGVLKLEPREADQVLVPALSLVEKDAGELCALADVVSEGLRSGREGSLAQAIEAVDAVVLAPNGLHESEVEALRHGRAELAERRRYRARTGRAAETLSLGT